MTERSGRVVADDADLAPGRSAPAAAAVAVALGALLGWAAEIGAIPLLVAVAVVQLLFGVAWLGSARVPGGPGGVVLGAVAACAADAAVSVWPHSRLGPLLGVLGLAVPAMFVHQLIRGTARMRVVESLGAITVLVLGVVCGAALLQARHEFGAGVATAIATGAAAAITAAVLVDLLPSGGAATVVRPARSTAAGAVAGAAVASLLTGNVALLGTGDAVLVGGVTGAVAAALALASARARTGGGAQATASASRSHAQLGGRLRPVLDACLPLLFAAPVGFALCLAVVS